MVALRNILPSDRERMLDILTSEKVNKTYMIPDFPEREAAIPLFQRLMDMSQSGSKYVRAIDLDGGLIGFVNQVDLENQTIELGYVIHPDFHGMGYMTQALKLAIAEMFEKGYTQVITGAFSTNAASLRVMEKSGMERLEKTDEIEYRGQVHTCIYYSARKQSYQCCFCGKSAADRDAYGLLITRAHDPEGPAQELYCHRTCLERRLADPKDLYLKYM